MSRNFLAACVISLSHYKVLNISTTSIVEKEVPVSYLKTHQEMGEATLVKPKIDQKILEVDFSKVSLRLLAPSDIDHFMVWATDPKVTKFCTFEPYTSKEDGLKFITDVVLSHPYFRAICLDGIPIGSLSVTKNSGNDRCRGELGYVLAAKYWGKGIATRAVKMVVKEIFEERAGLERLEAFVDVENLGSQRVLERVGFTREGVLRKYVILKGRTCDLVLFSFLRTDLAS